MKFRVEAERITDFYMIIEADSERQALWKAEAGGELLALETVETHTTKRILSASKFDTLQGANHANSGNK